MDNKTYNKIQETLSNIENQLRQLGRDVGHQPIEKEKAFGVILLKGDNEGCTTQILSTPTIAAKMILQCISNHPEVAQEIKRIQAIAKLERISSLLETMFPNHCEETTEILQRTLERLNCKEEDDNDNDDDKPDTQATFSVRLVDVHNDVISGNMLKVVKFLKESKDLSLKEAADLVKTTPSIIFNNLSIAEVEKIVNELTKFGAVCEIVEDKKQK